MASGQLFVVATPIGNLSDISPRAVEVLRSVDLIAAEDTRHSKRLLTHLGIGTPLTSYHEHNEVAKSETLVATLVEGKSVALITDAGTPCISDPGYRLVRAAQDAGISVVSIPGPSAVLAALSVSGLPTDRFTYHGFFPRKRQAAADALLDISRVAGTHVFFEAPNRLSATLIAIAASVPPGTEACVARELTKIHEEIRRDTPEVLAAYYTAHPPRGECAIMLHIPARKADENAPAPEQIREMVESLMEDEDLSRRDAIRKLSTDLRLPRNAVYAAARELE